jgi:hypothetical protein
MLDPLVFSLLNFIHSMIHLLQSTFEGKTVGQTADLFSNRQLLGLMPQELSPLLMK